MSITKFIPSLCSRSQSTRARRTRLTLHSLEERAVPATVLVAESTFNPDAFAENVHEYLDFNVMGYGFSVNYNGNADVANGTGGIYGPDLGRARTLANAPGTNFTVDTRIEVASVTKIVTTATVLHLLQSEEGDVDALLSTPIAEFLPADWTYGANVNGPENFITIRHLLTHTSGFFEGGDEGSVNPLGINFESFSNNSFQNLRAMVAAGVPNPTVTLPDGSLGNPRSYSNVNFSLLAKMVPYMRGDVSHVYLDQVSEWANEPIPLINADAVFGAYFEEYVRDNILGPAGVVDASMSVQDDNPAVAYNFSDGELVSGMGQANYTDKGGAFGLKANAPELAHFLRELRHGDAILSPATRDLMDNQEFLLGWDPNTASGTNPLELSPFADEWGTYYDHGGSAGNPTQAFKSEIVVMPGGVEAALVLNSDTADDNVTLSNFQVLRTSYANAWSDLVIEGNSDPNTFELRINADDPERIDIIVDGDVISSPLMSVLQSLELRGLGGIDTFNIEDLPEHVNLVLDGGSGNDGFNIGNPLGSSVFDYIFGNLSILGGDDADSLELADGNGIGEDYSIAGLDNGELEVDGQIDASNYSDGAMFLYGGIETLTLFANTDPNMIKISDIPGTMTVNVFAGGNDDHVQLLDVAAGATINLRGEGGGDLFEVWNIAADALINVYGDPPAVPGVGDTLIVGHGDLGTVGGKVTFDGAAGADLLILDDSAAPAARTILFELGRITGFGGFGEVQYATSVENIRLDAGGKDDSIYVDELAETTDVELFGHDGSDYFAVGAAGHDVSPVDGDVVIHGGSGFADHTYQPPDLGQDDDSVHVFDDDNAAKGDFKIEQYGDVLHGRLTKLSGTKDPQLNVIYDQIERTELRSGAGVNKITIAGAPLFNQVTVRSGDGNDKIDIESTPLFAGRMSILAEGGSDTIRVSPIAKNLDNLKSELFIDGGIGAAGDWDHVAISDLLSGNTKPYAYSDAALTRSGSAGVAFTGLEDLVIGLSNASNDINVSSSPKGTFTTIFGNNGNDSLTASNLTGPVLFNGGAGAKDEATLAGTGAADSFVVSGNNLQLGDGVLTAFVEARALTGGGGVDHLLWQGVDNTNEFITVRPSTTAFAGKVTPNPYQALYYDSVEQMSVAGNPGDTDRLQVNGQTQANILFGGAFHDQFDINMAATGGRTDPFLVLRNDAAKEMLTLLDYSDVGTPTINGLLGADAFNVRMSSAGLENRYAKLIGGGVGGLFKGDILNIYYQEKGAEVSCVTTTPTSGKVAIAYPPLEFGIRYSGILATNLIPE